ncbi:hypothetical protein [Nannocystis pusilla]|uniref:hypothetical protein n=1 Tax=Nannocystis pusilla TaxID=889268 RepID=UPI003DA27ED0
MKQSMMSLGVLLAAGGCRLFAAPSEPSRVDQLLDEAERDAKEAMARWERAEQTAKQSEKTAGDAIEKVKEYEVRYKAAEAERERYAGALDEAREAARTCVVSRERLIALHEILLEYVSEPRRDAAIAGLEPCRKAAAKPSKADRERENAAMRKDVATALERSFDAAHPDQRGHLIATVKGDVLDVDMPRFSAWDAATSQGHVDSWCDKVPNFTSIVVRNMNGTFKCRPKEQPKDYDARMLRAAGLADSWVPPPSGQKIPPPAEGEADIAEMERLGREMQVAVDQFEADSIALDGAKERAENAVAHYEEMVKEASR